MKILSFLSKMNLRRYRRLNRSVQLKKSIERITECILNYEYIKNDFKIKCFK